MAQKRKLTQAEIKRTDRFQERAEALEREGYDRTDLTVAINTASLLSFLVMLPFVLIIAVPYLMRYGTGSIGSIGAYLLSLALFMFARHGRALTGESPEYA